MQGKGTFVAGGNKEMLRESRMRRVEELLTEALRNAWTAGIPVEQLHEMLDLLSEDE